jgi:hypothetical protein
MKSFDEVPQVGPQVLFVLLHGDAVDSRYLASFQSAKRMPQQLISEQ